MGIATEPEELDRESTRLVMEDIPNRPRESLDHHLPIEPKLVTQPRRERHDIEAVERHLDIGIIGGPGNTVEVAREGPDEQVADSSAFQPVDDVRQGLIARHDGSRGV